jgi:iron complex outermembrane receptor protein
MRQILLNSLIATLILLPSFLHAENITAEQVASMSFEQLLSLKVTTPSRFEDKRRDTASSVSTVSETEWRRRGAKRAMDAIRHLPGLYISESFEGTYIPTFRGFGGITSFSGYALKLDGVPINTYNLQTPAFTFLDTPPDTLEQIEVVKGPGSAMYGTDSYNGLIAFKSWDPEEDTTQVLVSAGTFEHHSETARAKHSLGENASLTLIAANTNRSNSDYNFEYTESLSLAPSEDEVEAANFAQSYIAKVTLGDFEFGYYFNDSRRKNLISQPEVLSQGIENGTPVRASSASNLYRFTYETDLSSSYVLEATASHFTARRDFQGPSHGPLGLTADPPSEIYIDRSADRRSMLDVVLKRPFVEGSSTRGLIGYTLDYNDNQFYANGFNTAEVNPLSGKTRRTHSVYTQIEQELFEGDLRLVAGGRYDYYSDFGSQLTPRAAAIYHFLDNSTLKLLYGRAFRAPAMQEQIGTLPVLKGGGSELDPELVDTYEVVFMQGGESFQFGLTGFFNDRKDGIVIGANPTGDAPLRWENSGNSESYGVELDLVANLSDFNVRLTYTAAKARNKGVVDGDEAYRAFPDHILHSAVEYYPSKRVVIGLYNTNYFGQQSLEPLNTGGTYTNGPLPDYWRTDLYGGYTFDALSSELELFLQIEDLFDRGDISASLGSLERGVYGTGIGLTAGIKGTW